MFLEISRNSQGNTSAGVSETSSFISRKDSDTDVFLYILRNSKNAFVTEHLWWLLLLPVWIYLKLWYWKYKKAIFQGGHLHSRKWHYQHTGNCSLWLRWTKAKINEKFPRDRNTTWKVSKNGVISGPYIPVLWLNTGFTK